MNFRNRLVKVGMPVVLAQFIPANKASAKRLFDSFYRAKHAESLKKDLFDESSTNHLEAATTFAVWIAAVSFAEIEECAEQLDLNCEGYATLVLAAQLRMRRTYVHPAFEGFPLIAYCDFHRVVQSAFNAFGVPMTLHASTWGGFMAFGTGEDKGVNWAHVGLPSGLLPEAFIRDLIERLPMDAHCLQYEFPRPSLCQSQ